VALKLPLKCPWPQLWPDDHGDELESRRASGSCESGNHVCAILRLMVGGSA